MQFRHIVALRRQRRRRRQAEIVAQRAARSQRVGTDPRIDAPQVVDTARVARRKKICGERIRLPGSGAGIPQVQVPGGLSEDTLRMLGQLLREAMQGTLDLLRARSTTKRELRAELTMIVPRENNPLKFSPTVEAALTHMLSQQASGFMAPLDAMRDAYADLLSHQFGFIAGMRAALAGVIARFDPAQLESRLTQKRVIDSILPGARKAKLWELFAELYAEISRETEDDFHEVFGNEFLRAYEAQIAKLERKE